MLQMKQKLHLMAVSYTHLEVTMWHYFDQKPEQEMLADMVEEYNSLQDDIHINATFVSRTELMNCLLYTSRCV